MVLNWTNGGKWRHRLHVIGDFQQSAFDNRIARGAREILERRAS